MVMIPVKWLPWLLIAGGIYGIADGQVGGGLFIAALGAVWAYYWFFNKKK